MRTFVRLLDTEWEKGVIEDIDRYAAFTEAGDWAGICSLNSTKYDTFGTKKEIRVLKEYLEPTEIVLALSSGTISGGINANALDGGLNTWLVVLTNERFLLLDCAMFTSSVDTQSIRLERVQAVSSSQGWILGKILIDIGARVIAVDNCQKDSVSSVANLANKLLRDMQVTTRRPADPSGGSGTGDFLADLERLAALRTSGVLDEEEFKAAKAKLLQS